MKNCTSVLASILLFDNLALAAAALPKGLSWQMPAPEQRFGDPEAQAGGEVVLPIADLIPSFNPLGAVASNPALAPIRNLLWPMLGRHPLQADQLVPLLAEGWAQSADLKTLYFRLDPAARWSDGKLISAQDVLLSLKIWGQHGDPEQRALVTKIAEATMLDRQSLRIRLRQPLPAAVADFGALPVLPAHHFVDVKRAPQVSEPPPSSGPYVLGAHGPGGPYEFTAVPNWWGRRRPWFMGRYNPTRIRLVVVGAGEAAFWSLANGEIDALPIDSAKLWRGKMALLQKGYAYRVEIQAERPRPCLGLWINTRFPQLQKPGLRAALFGALSFPAIANKASAAELSPLTSCYDGYGEFSSEMIQPAASQAATAESLVSLGYSLVDAFGVRLSPTNDRLSFPLAYLQGTDEVLVRGIQTQAAGVGIELILQSMTLNDWQSATKANQYALFYGGFQADANARPDFRSIWHTSAIASGLNLSRISDSGLDGLIASFESELDPALQIRHAQAIQMQITEAKVFLPGLSSERERLALMRWVQLPRQNLARLSRGDLLEPFAPERGGLFWIDRAERERTRTAMRADKTFDAQTRIDKAPVLGEQQDNAKP